MAMSESEITALCERIRGLSNASHTLTTVGAFIDYLSQFPREAEIILDATFLNTDNIAVPSSVSLDTEFSQDLTGGEKKFCLNFIFDDQ